MSSDQPSQEVVVEIERAAVVLLTEEAYTHAVLLRHGPNAALGPLRLAKARQPDRTSRDGTPGYTLRVRRQYLWDIYHWCRELAGVLSTFPDEPDRRNAEVLTRTARAIEDALQLESED
jgi:hypothetical protein